MTRAQLDKRDKELKHLKGEKMAWVEKCLIKGEQPYYRSNVKPIKLNLEDPHYRIAFAQKPLLTPAEIQFRNSIKKKYEEDTKKAEIKNAKRFTMSDIFFL